MRFSNVRRVGGGKLLSAVSDGETHNFYLSSNGRVDRKIYSSGKTSDGGSVFYGQSYAAVRTGGAVVRTGGGVSYEKQA